MFDSVFCLGNVRRSRTGGITMAELRPDQAQLAKQGQAGLSPYPYTPNVPQDLVANSSQFSTDLLGRLGNVMADQAIRRQEMLNSTLVTDALNTATSELNKITQAQLERKGWQVGKQSATDTTEERQDAMTEYTQMTEQLINNMLPKFTNDKQREMFSMQIANSVISGASTVAQHVFNEDRQTLINGYNSRVSQLNDSFINYVSIGEFDKAQAVLQDVKNYIPMVRKSLGATDVEITTDLNNFFNQAIGSASDILTQNGQYTELGKLKMKFGDSLTTGKTKEVMNKQAVQAENMTRIEDIKNKIISDPSVRDENGDYDPAKVNAKIAELTTTTSRVTIDTQSIGSGQTAIDILRDTAILTENSGETAENPESGAYGREQVTPDTFELIKNGIGKGIIPADATLKDPYARKIAQELLLKDLYEKADYDPVAVAVGYAGGEDMMLKYIANPNSSDWDTTTVAGDQTVREYVQKWSANLAKHNGVNSAKKVPTANIPLSKGDAPDLENLKPEMKSAIPVIGGMLTQLGYGDSMLLTSGYRTKEYQMQLNPKASNSYHIYGDALDIYLGDNLSQEERDKVTQAFKNTGAFQEVLYHQVSGGYHLHLGGYNGSLGDGSVTMGITPTTKTVVYQDPTLSAQTSQAILTDVYSRNATTQANRAKAIQSLYGGRYANELDVKAKLEGVTYVDGDGNTRHLTSSQISQAVPSVWGSSTTAMQLNIDSRNYALTQRQRSENAYKFRQALARGELDGSIKTYNDFMQSDAYQYATDEDKNRVKQSFESGTFKQYAGAQKFITAIVDNVVKAEWDNNPVEKWAVYSEVEGKVLDYMNTHNGQLPTSTDVQSWAVIATQNAVVDKGYFSDDSISGARLRETQGRGVTVYDDGTAKNKDGQTLYYDSDTGVWGTR